MRGQQSTKSIDGWKLLVEYGWHTSRQPNVYNRQYFCQTICLGGVSKKSRYKINPNVRPDIFRHIIFYLAVRETVIYFDITWR